MEPVTRISKENKTLDVFKFYACILIAATHLPSVFSSTAADFYFNQWYFRFAVPLFFVSTGYFFFRTKQKAKSLKRIFELYLLAYLLYLPRMLRGVGTWEEAFSVIRWNLVIGYEHLWYLNATLQGLLIWFVLEKIPVISSVFRKTAPFFSIVMLILGTLLDEHYRLMSVPLLQKAGDFLQIFGGPRNVLFMGLPLLLLGGAAAQYEEKLCRLPVTALCGAWIVLRFMGFQESMYLLRGLGSNINNDVTLFGCLAGWVLFVLSFRFQIPIGDIPARNLRKMAEYVYVLHPLAAMGLSALPFVSFGPLSLLISTVALCCVLCVLKQKLSGILKKRQ